MESPPAPHVTHEVLRKVVHILFGFCALALRWLPWQAAAAIAAAAIAGNFLLLHRVFGKRIARDARGYDAGIVIYPAAVLVLILVFRNHLEIAGTVWAILAFGDGFATLAGKTIGGPRLPWNRDKRWSGLAAFAGFGILGTSMVYFALRPGPAAIDGWAIVTIAVLACAVVESLALHLDDNVTVPLTGAAFVSVLTLAASWPVPQWGGAMLWLVVNTVLAIAGYLARSVDRSGLFGGWFLGAVIILFGGWQLYLVLLTFFVIGTGATRLGYRRKAAEGLAQEREGRRGFSHAFSNVGVAALLAVAAQMVPAELVAAFWFAAAAALATAAADTTASELGPLIGRRTFLPLSFRSVPVGTEGAVSIEGTAAGLLAGILVATVASVAILRTADPRIIGTIAVAALGGSYIESIAGAWNRTRENSIPNGALNVFNTAAGAAICLALLR